MSDKVPPNGSQTHDLDKKTPAIDATGEKRYQWPPVRDPDLAYKPKSRNAVHSIITALPIIMLATGLLIYYLAEFRQTHGVPIQEETIELAGIFTGFSATSDRHYLWVEIDGVAKGVRIQPEQLSLLDELKRGEPVELKVAPQVSGSTTYWAWQLKQGGTAFLEH